MNNLWVRLGCFLTGYNYKILKSSSEASAKAVKKYLSAILIVATLWGFIGYCFTQRYLHGSFIISLIGALIMIVVIIQIERQIILSIGKNNWAFSFRFLIGLVMAVIGSIILDQIIFKDDVEKAKISSVQSEVNKLLPIKTQELNNQIQQLNYSIQQKENERASIISDIGKNPTILAPSTSVVLQKDSTGQMKQVNKTITNNSVVNPKASLVPQIDSQLKYLRDQKTNKENSKLNIQQDLEKDLQSKIGFLDELKTLFSILFSSPIALAIWSLLFLFFLAIELFVVVNKFGDKINDYDRVIVHQMEIRIKMLEKLVSRDSGV